MKSRETLKRGRRAPLRSREQLRSPDAGPREARDHVAVASRLSPAPRLGLAASRTVQNVLFQPVYAKTVVLLVTGSRDSFFRKCLSHMQV